MKRREFLGKVGTSLASVAAGGAVVTACGGNQSTTANEGTPAVHTQKKIRWRLASSFPRSLDTIFGAAEFMSERVKAMTDGNFDIRVYPGGELVPGLQVLDAVQNETVQLGQTCSYYYTGKNPVLAFDTCVPFGLTARQQQAWLGEGGGGELMAKVFSDFGIRSFPSGNTGAQMGGWFKEELSGLDGLKGLKMRIPGLGGDVMSALGASVQVIAGGEIYPALERGAIDATEWVGPYDDEKLGFYKVAKNYYYPGWWEPGPSMSIYIGEKAWASLPVIYQEILKSAIHEAGLEMQRRYDARNPAALQRILSNGVTLRPFSDDLLAGALEASIQILEDNAAKDEGYATVYKHWKNTRSEQFKFFSTAELAYAKFAYPRG
jgi:TRAP-type mannitol/chloroaromatic compound transport system substrate-binding protein